MSIFNTLLNWVTILGSLGILAWNGTVLITNYKLYYEDNECSDTNTDLIKLISITSGVALFGIIHKIACCGIYKLLYWVFLVTVVIRNA